MEPIIIVFVVAIPLVLLIALAAYDLLQRKHAILRNFPIIGHFRYWLEAIGPELRQYIVTGNDEERPFSRDQRRWVYASSKHENNYFGFGTDQDLELRPNYLIVKHSPFPLASPNPGDSDYDPEFRIPCMKVMGEHRGRSKAFRPSSVVNVSGMSYGSLSARAIEALNRGCAIAGCLQSTGEGGLSPHHLHGGELIWQIGTGYFGCRELDGRFSIERLRETVDKHPQVRAIEIKLSQGAKPGAGGILPKAKITREIAEIRGIPMDRDCLSPAGHTAFGDTDGLLDFAESIAEATGLPVGIKSAVGQMEFWTDLARLISTTNRAVDFVTIDGGEGGTGAGPLVFTDHVALPFKQAFARVQKVFMEHGVQEQVVFIGSGKLGFPETALLAFALGCDMIAVAREAMLAIGCIQAQRCHTNHCPTGVATQNRWLVRGLNPASKSARLANYIVTLRKDLLALSRACGVTHPAYVTADQLEILDDRFGSATIAEVFGCGRGFGVPIAQDVPSISDFQG
ncbi:MAG: FMN-binding glutamate synthase family protein [Planctomycetes bacterium]|nr:FMN-binding glutamate synthase family protein [Planctomycetota bacterium]MBL7043462.1 FMN-binding glutamate synthase family protein [Pirellulaceae bacterium]